jgi:HAD superfamily phosphatase (TIGR01668 family)
MFNKNSSFLIQKIVKVSDIKLELLQSLNIKGVIIDLDNTIISEDDKYLSPNSEEWIQEAKQLGFRFFMLSNGKRRWRIEFWSNRLDIPAISPAKKPFPRAFRRAISSMDVRADQVVVIGDSLHTDVIGAWLSGCWSIQVATLPHKPRWWEKIAGRWIQSPYPLNDLWIFDNSQYSRLN